MPFGPAIGRVRRYAMDALHRSATTPRRRVAVVVHRYGPGIVGGAEQHARLLVTALAPLHDVSVLTSCALDASTWAMHFAPGVAVEDGVTVKRFAHPQRERARRPRLPLRHRVRYRLRSWLDAAGRDRAWPLRGDPDYDGCTFLRQRGPQCDGLFDDLRSGDYEVVVFMTAVQYTTIEGLPIWGRRSVLIPTMHDERAMILPCFRRVFASAGLILYNTEAERRLARLYYGADAGAGDVVGTYVTAGEPSAENVAAVRTRYELPERYLVYVGRIQRGKGCARLLAAWRALGGETDGTALVFVGSGSLSIAPSPSVRVTGYVDDADRDALIAGAAGLVMPSRYESLSLVLLEAFSLGVPVLVNAECAALAEQVAASGAGEAYRGRRELRAGLRRALARTAADRHRLGEAGRRFVAARYRADIVTRKWCAAIERVCAPGGALAVEA